jgi:hypothetical protein
MDDKEREAIFDKLARESGYEPARPPLGWYNRYDEFDHLEFARKVWATAVNSMLDQNQ